VTLAILHPEVAWRDCNSCRIHQYDEDTGEVELDRNTGEPLRRAKGTSPPCRYRRGCPKGTPEDQRALTNQNQRAWDHYRECRAVGVFPDDPIVRRHAALLRDVEDSCRRKREMDRLISILSLFRR
jgi:hypothetical protein